jgi:hypothetical protein
MPGKTINNLGFTLLEVVTSIMVMTIIGVIAGMGFVEIAKGYTLSKKNATVTQQGQITMARIKKELASIKSISCGSDKLITYTITRSATDDTSTIYWSDGNPIRLKTGSEVTVCTNPSVDGDALVENVSNFTLSYCKDNANCSSTFPDITNDYTTATVSFVKVVLKLKGYDDIPISIADPDMIILNQESGG